MSARDQPALMVEFRSRWHSTFATGPTARDTHPYGTVLRRSCFSHVEHHVSASLFLVKGPLAQSVDALLQGEEVKVVRRIRCLRALLVDFVAQPRD